MVWAEDSRGITRWLWSTSSDVLRGTSGLKPVTGSDQLSVSPGSVQELGLGAEEFPKTGRKMGACCSQHAAQSIVDGDVSDSTCERDSLCALQLVLGEQPELTAGKCGSTLWLPHEYAKWDLEVQGQQGPRG